MRFRLYTRTGQDLAVGTTNDKTSVQDVFAAMQRGDLCIDSVQLDEQPVDAAARPAPPKGKQTA